MIDTLINEHGVPEKEIVKESGHCMHPKFLEQQLEGSLKRMNLDALDVFYL
jgi:aryl-alcohol dehydrogenase-like predicted oxidoreductase